MSACPNCFQELHPTYYVWGCTSGTCERQFVEKASAYLGMKVEYGTFTTWNVAEHGGVHPTEADAVCSACNAPATELCPDCLLPVPAGWRNVDVISVAMNGARSTGKTVYITVMIQQLTQLLVRHQATIRPFNTSTREVYETHYLDPLYKLLGVPKATQPTGSADAFQREPMIFSLGTLKGRPRYLVIRDVAGEEMEDLPDNRTHLQFLRHADAIFFMFDPLAVPEIRARLRGVFPMTQPGGEPSEVMNNLRELLGSARPPLAVVLSKFDSLQALRGVRDAQWNQVMSNTGAGYLRDPGNDVDGFDDADSELVSLEVESLLHLLGGQTFLFTLSDPGHGGKFEHRFFAISSLGEPADETKISEFGISSFRVLDPIKWVMHRKGIL